MNLDIKFHYIFHVRDNGYGINNDHYLFSSDKPLSKEITDNIQKQILGAERIGVSWESFLEKSKELGFNFKLVFYLDKIPIIENITGNY